MAELHRYNDSRICNSCLTDRPRSFTMSCRPQDPEPPLRSCRVSAKGPVPPAGPFAASGPGCATGGRYACSGHGDGAAIADRRPIHNGARTRPTASRGGAVFVDLDRTLLRGASGLGPQRRHARRGALRRAGRRCPASASSTASTTSSARRLPFMAMVRAAAPVHPGLAGRGGAPGRHAGRRRAGRPGAALCPGGPGRAPGRRPAASCSPPPPPRPDHPVRRRCSGSTT